MLIINAKIITMTDTDYENGFILIEDGKITDVGNMLNAPHCNEIYDAKGGVAVPGFIDAHCHMGIIGDGIDSEGADANEENNAITPDISVIDAINPMYPSFADALSSGVTTVVVSPGSSNVVCGRIAAVKTNQRCIDDAVIKSPIALKVAFGENPKKGKNSVVTRMGIADALRKYLRDNKVSVPIHAHAHRADDILTAIRIAKEFDLSLKLIHATEGYLVADKIAKENIEVMVGPIICDRNKPELANLSLSNAAFLEKAGVKVSIITDHPEVPINFLLLSAQLAAKNGMSERGALRAVTIHSAEIAGIQHRVGAIKKGLDGDIVIFDQNPMEFSSKITKIFIS